VAGANYFMPIDLTISKVLTIMRADITDCEKLACNIKQHELMIANLKKKYIPVT
jgi:hypothetical protein